MIEIVASYTVTVIIAWAVLWRTWWVRIATKVAAGEVKDIEKNALDNAYTKQALILMIGALAFITAFAWPAVVVAFVIFKVAFWLFHMGHTERR